MATTGVAIGYRFVPSDEELIRYLADKVAGNPLPSMAVVEADVYGTEPWNLLKNGDPEAYFFAVRKRKGAVGTRVDRRAGTGTWTLSREKEEFVAKLDADGRESCQSIKSSLTFHDGKKKNSGWIMYEYELCPSDGEFQTQVVCHIKNRAASGKKKKRSQEATNISTTQPHESAPAVLEPSPICDWHVYPAGDQALESLASMGYENAQPVQLHRGQASDLDSWEDVAQFF